MSTGVIAWCVGAALAVGVGMLALSAIGVGLTDRALPPLAAGAMESSAAGTTPVASARATRPPLNGATAKAVPSVTEQILSIDGGSVAARCTDDRVYLASWSPAQGFRVDEVRRGPATTATVKFVSTRREYTMRVRCVAGVPQGSVEGEEHAGEDR
jgi:hypothetical protein